MTKIRKFSTSDPDFRQQLDGLLAWESVSDEGVKRTVEDIIADIRARGDEALLEYTSRFDGWQAQTAGDLEIPRERLERAWQGIPP